MIEENLYILQKKGTDEYLVFDFAKEISFTKNPMHATWFNYEMLVVFGQDIKSRIEMYYDVELKFRTCKPMEVTKIRKIKFEWT